MTVVDLIQSMAGYVGANGRTEDQITTAEKIAGTVFAQDYRLYLREIGLACYDGHELTGITTDIRLNVADVTKEERERSDIDTSNWYVIEETGIDGIVIWQNSNGEVYQTVMGSQIKKIADSFSEYIRAYS